MARATGLLERRLGPGLVLMGSERLYRRLGYVRLADYLGERLGMSLHRYQRIARLSRAVRDLPLVARALESGTLPPSKLHVVASVATPETQELWLGRARRLTVRGLEELARAGDSATPADAPCSAPESTAASEGPGGLADEDEPGAIISFAAPGRTVALWHWSLDLMRRVAGQQEPVWRCVEYLAAEFLSGVPDLSPAGAAATSTADADPVAGVATSDDPVGGHSDLAAHASRYGAATDAALWEEAVAAARDALRSLGSAADIDSILAGHVPGDSRTGSARQDRDDLAGASREAAAADRDPWALDACLRSLVALRQSIAWRLGRLLRPFCNASLHREIGFSSLEDWCREALGISPRRVRYLVSLDRRLQTLPVLADAYRRGRVSWCQVRQLVRVVQPSTQTRWIRYARQVTVRRLEDAVAECAVAAALEDSAVGHHEASTHRQGTGAVSAAPLPPREPSPGRAADASGRSLPFPALGRHTSSPDPSHGMWLAPGAARHRIVFWLPLDVAGLWNAAIRACRRVSGRHLSEWECLEALIASARETWEDAGDPGWRRRYRIFERDGWRCQAPGCTSRGNLNEHHIVLRSQGGGDEESNLVTLCVGHHQQGVHEGRVRCRGRAPGELWWDLGVRPDGPPLARYFGDLLLGSPVALNAVGLARNPAP